MKTLPSLPSDLLELALEDLKKAEKNPNYKIDMGDWHTPDGDACSVCMAGAVIGFTLDAGFEDMNPYDFPKDIQDKLLAINALRKGGVTDAEDWLPALRGKDIANFKVVHYKVNPEKFKSDIQAMIEGLRKYGV